MLYGIFVPDGNGGLNLIPEAWSAHKKNSRPGSPFPAQQKFKVLHRCAPMKRAAFQHIPTKKSEKYGNPIFDMWLNQDQTRALIRLFMGS